MMALGDIKQLNHEQLMKGTAIEYKVKPPVNVPTSLENTPLDMLPGGRVFSDMSGPNSRIQSLWEVNLDLGDLREDIYDIRSEERRVGKECRYSWYQVQQAKNVKAKHGVAEDG